MAYRQTILLLFIILSLNGCATSPSKYYVYVDSINAGSTLPEKKAVILTGMKDVAQNDLNFKEFSSYLERALISRGYQVTTNPEEAKIGIFLSYGIGNPEKHQQIFSVPIFGQTGVASSTTSGTISPYGSYQGTTSYTPSYGIVGATTHSRTSTTYMRFILLHAIDLDIARETGSDQELWKTEIISTGSSNDLRKVFPALVTAATPYLGSNTGQKVLVELREDSKEILQIKGVQPSQ